MIKNKEDEALTTMVALEGAGATKECPAIITELATIKRILAVERGEKDSQQQTQQLMPKFRVVLGVGCQVMQQLTGINIICYYLPVVLNKSVGLTGEVSRLLSGVNATTYLLATFIGLKYIEKWGRRRLMMYGAFGQFLCWMIIATLLGCGRTATLAKKAGLPNLPATEQNGPSSPLVNIESPMERRLAEASVAFFFIFNIFFGAGWQGVSWLYPTEINTTQKRIMGMAAGVGMNWLINFGVVFATPKGIESLGYKYYIIWTVFNLVFLPIIYLFYPETAHRSLEQIDALFEAHPTVWVYKHKSLTSITLLSPDEESPKASDGSTQPAGSSLYADVAGQAQHAEKVEPKSEARSTDEAAPDGVLQTRAHRGDTLEGTATLGSAPTSEQAQHVVSTVSNV